MTDPLGDSRARTGFIVLNLVRIAGLVMVLIGLAAEYGRVDLPRPVGIALVLFGFYAFFFLPRVAVRRWRSPPE